LAAAVSGWGRNGRAAAAKPRAGGAAHGHGRLTLIAFAGGGWLGETAGRAL